MDNQFGVLRVYSTFTKVMSALSLVTGLILEGVTTYGWGRLTAFYDMLRAAWQAFANGLNNSAAGISVPAELAPLPIWPLLVVMFIVLIFTVTFALTLWAGGEWIDMRLTLAKEERESRAMLFKSMSVLTRDLNAIAGYFSSLPRK